MAGPARLQGMRAWCFGLVVLAAACGHAPQPRRATSARSLEIWFCAESSTRALTNCGCPPLGQIAYSEVSPEFPMVLRARTVWLTVPERTKGTPQDVRVFARCGQETIPAVARPDPRHAAKDPRRWAFLVRFPAPRADEPNMRRCMLHVVLGADAGRDVARRPVELVHRMMAMPPNPRFPSKPWRTPYPELTDDRLEPPPDESAALRCVTADP